MAVEKFAKLTSRAKLMVSSILTAISTPLLADKPTLGTVASNITGSFEAVTKLITGGCYLAGLGFAVTAILKFKQHKDTPQQVTIGTPIALVLIAAALLF